MGAGLVCRRTRARVGLADLLGLSVTGPTWSIDAALGPTVRTAAFNLGRVLRESGL